MKILKLLNKKYLLTFIIFIFLFSLNLNAEDEPVDIWDLEKKVEQDESTTILENDESNEIKIEVEKNDPNNLINTFYLTILKFSFGTTSSIFFMGDGKLIRSIKIMAIMSNTIANVNLINIPKIPFEFPILVFFSNCI